jgi:hypothetical protein
VLLTFRATKSFLSEMSILSLGQDDIGLDICLKSERVRLGLIAASRIFGSFGELWAMLSRDAPGEARRGPSAFISLRRWVSMKHRLGERLVSGCKASRLVPA